MEIHAEHRTLHRYEGVHYVPGESDDIGRYHSRPPRNATHFCDTSINPPEMTTPHPQMVATSHARGQFAFEALRPWASWWPNLHRFGTLAPLAAFGSNCRILATFSQISSNFRHLAHFGAFFAFRPNFHNFRTFRHFSHFCANFSIFPNVPRLVPVTSLANSKWPLRPWASHAAHFATQVLRTWFPAFRHF